MLSQRNRIFLLFLFEIAFGAIASDCASHQVLMKDKCVDCKTMQYGCNECSRIRTKKFMSLTNTDVVQCDVCDFGMYKLTLDDNEGQTTAGQDPYMATMCVKRCEDFGHNYVSNPSTMQCEYCGPECTRCTLQYGCVECAANNDGIGFPNATSYIDLLRTTKGITYPQFPYNYFATTKNGGPSSEFQVCSSCDSRCRDCSDFISEETAYATAYQAALKTQEAKAKVTGVPASNSALPKIVSIGQCKNCHNYVQSAADQRANGNICKLMTGKVNNCVQVDPKNETICAFCKKDYYVEKGNCTICQSSLKQNQGCKRCDQFKCLECMDGYSLENGRCTKCAMANTNSAMYSFVTNRCENCLNSTDTRDCKHCDIGWKSTTTNRSSQLLNPLFKGKVGEVCSFKCGEKEYPFVDQALIDGDFYQTKLDGRECMKCSTTCQNCAGSTNKHCTDCPAGSFLKITDPKAQIGSCEKKLLNKNLTFDIYVSNLIDEQVEQGRQRAGTYKDPFSQLSDALSKAKDLAAPYKQIVKVTIHMFAGDHFSLENRFDALNIYLPVNASDPLQMNLDITLKPMLCSPSTPSNCGSDPITIYNKIRERFLLDIYSKLTLEKIVIDSADSILPFGSLCLSQKRVCCKVQDQSLINADPRKDEQCQKHFDQMKLTDNCKNEQARTMFRAIDNSNRNQYEFTTNTLVLEKSEVRNVFYAMNSLVNITQQGGNITFSDSKFSNINICGSIIKNVQGMWHNADLSKISLQYISFKEQDYINTFQTLQYSLNPQSTYETGIYFPSGIRISGSQFTNINFQSSTIKDLPQVTEDGGNRYQGLILNLNSFKGDIIIQDTRFENNIFKFGSCMLDQPFTLPQPDFVNNFDVVYRNLQLDEFNLTLTRYNKLQLKSLIDIRNHAFPLGLYNNTFKQNTGLKGIINLEQAYNSTSKNSFMIYGNTFEQNSALIDSNVLNFRKLATPDQLTYRSSEDMKCGGLEFYSNTFLSNIGCKQTHGVMHIYCFGNSSGVEYSPELDSQYFIGNHYDENLLTQSPEEIKATFTSHKYNGTEFKVNDLQLVFRQNKFSKNFAGSQRSLVQIEGYPIFNSIKDVYKDNENWYPEAFNKFGNSVNPKVYGKKELVNFEFKAESMLTLWRPLIVEISGTVFENNFVVDDVDPEIKNGKVQSHGLLIRDFTGKILLNEGLSFNKNIGPSGGSFSKFMNTSYNQVGFKSRLMAFDRYKFRSFIVDSIKFQDNHLYSYNSTVNANPRFLNFTSSDFAQKFDMDVKKLEVTRNIFEYSDFVVGFHKVNMTFTNYVLDNNQGETSKSILKISMDAYSKIGFENLTASKNNMTLGPIIDLSLDTSILPSQSSCVEANLLISNSNILENTSKFKTTLFYLEDFPWLWVRFLKTNLFNNFGSVTNEIYAESIRRLDFYQSNWNQYASDIPRDFEPSTVNSAKFILMDKTDYILDVKDSDFNCNSIFDISMIFTMNKQREWGDSSLFKLERPSDPESLFCKNDKPVIKFNFVASTFQNCNQALRGAIFNIENGVVLQISSIKTYALNNSAIEGGFAFIQGDETKIIIKDAITLDAQNAYFGGSFSLIDYASIELSKVKIINAQVFEGIIYMDRNSYSSLLSLEFSNNFVQERAIIIAMDYSFFTLEDTIFDTNEIIGDAGIIQQDNSRNNKFYNGSTMTFELGQMRQSVIRRVTIQNTTMLYGGNLIKIINSNLLVDTINVYKNNIFSKSGGIHMSYSNVNIKNSVFDINNELNDRFYYDAEEIYIGEDNMGGYFLIGPNSTLVSKGNLYMNSRSNIGGCIAIQGFADASFEGDSFTKCSALTGGAISATDFDQLTVKNCTFENNIAFSGKGENIFAQRFHGTLVIQDSLLSSFMNSVYLDQGYDLTAKNLSMSVRSEILITTNRLDDQKFAGGFHFINMRKITQFENITMSNMTSDNGGCIFLGLDQNFRPQKFNDQPYVMKNLKLFGCRSTQDGGAIQMENVRKLSIIGGSIMSSTAAQNGGGINFNCADSTLDCVLSLQGVNISDNLAMVGGGINSNDVLPQIDTSARIFGNKAVLYGNDRASFPTKLVRFIPVSGMVKADQIAEGKSDRDYFIRYFNTKVGQDLLISDEDMPVAQNPILDEMAEFSVRMLILGIQSGGMIPIQYMALLDDQNQVVTSNRGSMIEITLSDIDTEIRGAMKFFSIYGVFNISGMQILTQPGQSNIIMTMTAEKRAIKTKGSEFKLEFDLQIRDCNAGEAQLQEGVNFICQRCREGTYLLEKPPPRTPVECKICPIGKAQCTGGNEIGPEVGFWRKSHMADAFLPCMEPDSCLGLFLYPDFKNISLRGYKPTGNCEEGYYGALCSACMPGYAAIAQYTCTKCGDRTANILKMLGIMVMAFSCIVLLIRSTLAGQMKRQTHSVFVKILMNHMQMILITSSFDMRWPEQVKDFLQTITPLMEFQRAIVSYDCFMDPRDPNTIGETEFEAGPTEFRITYYKLLIYASMPILLGMCSITVWYIILKFRTYRKRQNPREAGKEMKKLYDSFISTLVILLFLMHPTITNYMMDMFNCQEFDGDKRLLTDPQIVCNVNLHKKIAQPVAAICIIIWGVGIPALIYILMSKERERLDTEAAKIKYGFLYNGYKRDNYYWEIIIMYRKVLCLVVYVFFSDLGIVVQALVLLILLVVFTQLNNVTRPYCTRALNEVEDFSLYTQILTIYCGLFFISSADKTSSTYNASKDFVITDQVQYVLFFTIVSSNIAFMVLWFVKFILTLRVMIKQSSESLYIVLFLCCRRDKLIKEDSKLAREAKRETIIEKIEEIQFFIKKMRDIYSKEIFYEGHEKFLKLLYHIENERKHVDLTVKRHNLYVQGAIARERKLDPTRIQEVLKNSDLMIDADHGGNNLDMEQIKKSRKKVMPQFNEPTVSRPSVRRTPINIKQDMIGSTKQLMFDDLPFSSDGEKHDNNTLGSNLLSRDHKSSLTSAENIDFNSLSKVQARQKRGQMDGKMFPSMMSDAFSKQDDSGIPMIHLQNQEQGSQILQIQQLLQENIREKGKAGCGFESEEDKEDLKTKKKYKKPNVIDVQKDVNKSRNAKSRINYEQKERIFAEDLNNQMHVKTYMYEYFKDLVEPEADDKMSDMNMREDSPSPEKSPDKDSNAGKRSGMFIEQPTSMHGSHLNSPQKSEGKNSCRSRSNSGSKRNKLTTPKNQEDNQNDDELQTPRHGMDLQQIKVKKPFNFPQREGSSRSKASSSRRGFLKTNIDLLDNIDGSITSPKSPELTEILDEYSDMDSEIAKIRQDEGYRKRLRPEVNLNYSVKIEKEEINKEEHQVKIKVVEYVKPNLSKKKHKKRVQFDSGEEKEESITHDSDQLTLSILDSQDSNNVKLNYNREKQTQGAFVGSYSDRDSSQHYDRKKSRKSRQRIKEEQIQTPTETEHKTQALSITKLEKDSSLKTFQTNPQFYPSKSKESLPHGKSEMTLTAQIMHQSFNQGEKEGTVQTIREGQMPGALSAKNELVFVQSMSDAAAEEQYENMLPKTKMRNKKKKLEEPNLFKLIANLESVDHDDESSKD